MTEKETDPQQSIYLLLPPPPSTASLKMYNAKKNAEGKSMFTQSEGAEKPAASQRKSSLRKFSISFQLGTGLTTLPLSLSQGSRIT